ncbi:uncharacterized protein LOC119661965 [Teleopsis dalmanni]|uniref:uncharacterized protein LOC119661965 n=1 Tax=Teleopsis dalmanni TaxID=139649 RepID=UPI0018CCB1AF|nr:uncharacterized protein LOC119661965 [Teleopsis dalmanni]
MNNSFILDKNMAEVKSQTTINEPIVLSEFNRRRFQKVFDVLDKVKMLEKLVEELYNLPKRSPETIRTEIRNLEQYCVKIAAELTLIDLLVGYYFTKPAIDKAIKTNFCSNYFERKVNECLEELDTHNMTNCGKLFEADCLEHYLRRHEHLINKKSSDYLIKFALQFYSVDIPRGVRRAVLLATKLSFILDEAETFHRPCKDFIIWYFRRFNNEDDDYTRQYVLEIYSILIAVLPKFTKKIDSETIASTSKSTNNVTGSAIKDDKEDAKTQPNKKRRFF